MYNYLDKPLNKASASEKFFVWAIRGWLEAIQLNKCPRSFLKKGFEGQSGNNLFPIFNTFMSTLHAGAARDIRICSLPCRKITEDEALLLAAIAGLELGHKSPARAVFSDMLKPAAARRALTIARRLQHQLSTAGYKLNAPTTQPNRPY